MIKVVVENLLNKILTIDNPPSIGVVSIAEFQIAQFIDPILYVMHFSKFSDLKLSTSVRYWGGENDFIMEFLSEDHEIFD